jgi:hypothetical protein
MFLKGNTLFWIVVLSLSLDKMKPEEKVKCAINMTDVCVRICADGIKDENPQISEKELLEKVSERIRFGRSQRREV